MVTLHVGLYALYRATNAQFAKYLSKREQNKFWGQSNIHLTRITFFLVLQFKR
jgi:hypothetical protein